MSCGKSDWVSTQKVLAVIRRQDFAYTGEIGYQLDACWDSVEQALGRLQARHRVYSTGVGRRVYWLVWQTGVSPSSAFDDLLRHGRIQQDIYWHKRELARLRQLEPESLDRLQEMTSMVDALLELVSGASARSEKDA